MFWPGLGQPRVPIGHATLTMARMAPLTCESRPDHERRGSPDEAGRRRRRGAPGRGPSRSAAPRLRPTGDWAGWHISCCAAAYGTGQPVGVTREPRWGTTRTDLRSSPRSHARGTLGLAASWREAHPPVGRSPPGFSCGGGAPLAMGALRLDARWRCTRRRTHMKKVDDVPDGAALWGDAGRGPADAPPARSPRPVGKSAGTIRV